MVRARRVIPALARRGRWWRFGVLVVVTALVLVPIAVTVGSALGLPGAPGARGGAGGFPAAVTGLLSVLSNGPALQWFGNSLVLSVTTVVVCVLVGAPAGYVLSRGRGRGVSGFALAVFVMQSLPVAMAVVPLFILFARLGLVDSLFGIGLVYVGMCMSFAIWMLASYFDSIPIELEEAAWLDGCSVLGGFARVTLRNSLPGVLSTAIFAFLLAWNDYLVALVFLRSQANYTLGIGLEVAGHSPALAVLMMLPPVVIFIVLNRFFSVGGIGGALAAR